MNIIKQHNIIDWYVVEEDGNNKIFCTYNTKNFNVSVGDTVTTTEGNHYNYEVVSIKEDDTDIHTMVLKKLEDVDIDDLIYDI